MVKVGAKLIIELGQRRMDIFEEMTMKNIKIKCDIYTRVSTTMQVDSYSLDAQREKLERYAEF